MVNLKLNKIRTKVFRLASQNQNLTNLQIEIPTAFTSIG
jgi:hypothetical protein